ncbi:hypothetical protein [Stutzerimonas nitrititolerans]
MPRSLREVYESIRYEWSALNGDEFKVQARLLPIHKMQQLVFFNPCYVVDCLHNRSVRSRQFCIEQLHAEDVLDIEVVRGSIVETVKIMFEEGRSYEETPQYQSMLKAVLAGGPLAKERGAYWCRSPEDVKCYFNSLIEAYRKISLEGYKTQAELLREGSRLVRKRDDEIKLYVDSKGKLVLGGGGTHRLCIAKSLRLTKVPGLVRGVDVRWALKVYREMGSKRLDYSLHQALASNAWV